MNLSRFLSLLFLLSFTSTTIAVDPPERSSFRGYLLNCGATSQTKMINGLDYSPDHSFISGGVPKNLSIPNLLPLLSTLRSFPFESGNRPQKFCYSFLVYRGARYLVRATFFYGGSGGSAAPPVFDLVVDGTLWTVVNTTDDYGRGAASYYEGVFLAKGTRMSVCVAGNTYTESNPFISALEIIMLDDSVYTGTDFNTTAMGLIARSNFGYNGPTIGYPDDRFGRYWEPFADGLHSIINSRNLSTSGFWNFPPASILRTAAVVTDRFQPLELNWPPVPLPNSSYYVALYFADTSSSRDVNISINGISFYSNLELTASGAMVFATPWNLFGPTKITLTPGSAPLPPLINGGEMFGLFALGGVTITRDVIALLSIKKSINYPPEDWSGDPCMPRQYTWSGITCSEGPRIRVTKLDLSGLGLSGSLSQNIGNLTALTEISLASNNLSGKIPDLNRLKRLEKLYLQNNQFSGPIPSSLGNLPDLKELFLQNNNLTGEVPRDLIRPGLDLKISPGNHLTPSPPSG